jgi:hypothetical protein
MRKIKILILICICSVLKNVEAQQQVSSKEAKNAAISTLYKKTDVLKKSSETSIKTVYNLSNRNRDTLMYEVVFENGAAVLLSGNKACLPVLGYYTKPENDNGSIFDTNNPNVPCGLKALLYGYEQEIEQYFTQKNIELSYQSQWAELQQISLHKNDTRAIIHVGPLLKTKWGQSTSNNGVMCPAYNYYVTDTDNDCSCTSLCPVGCTAVAMGQIMKYWNNPVYLPNKVQQYDWCNMPDALNYYLPPIYNVNPNYEKERNAVARLLKDCADAANTNYCVLGTCNSFAYPNAARKALIDDFGYSSNADFRLRSSHPSGNVWINYIKTDLNAGRPVLYTSLSNIQNAHTFVVDGYDSDNKFSFNWGWRGNHDGWYALDGIGNIGGSNYNNWHEATFNIYPSSNTDYCNFTLPLSFHYAYWHNVSGIPISFVHAIIPQTATVLQSVPSGSSIPTSWHTIESGQSVTYTAHETIVLQPGFHAKAGSKFIARIEPCPSCGSTSRSMLFIDEEEGISEEFSQLKNLNDTLRQTSWDNSLTEKNLNKEISLFPNPNTGSFTIQTNNFDNIKQIQVINPLGQIIYTIQNPSDNTITLPNGAKGTYFVRITTETESVTRKILVE